MRRVQFAWRGGTVICAVSLFAQGAGAGSPGGTAASDDASLSFSLDGVYALANERAEWSALQPQTTTTTEETVEMTMDSGGDGIGGIAGPVFLRTTEPVAPGEVELKFVGRYGQPSSGSDEEWQFDFVAEWGIAENWEFILEVPVHLGDGRVEGNGDIGEFGFHTKLWDEGDWAPAFAVRNLIRIPTGYHSNGVDYQLRGLFSKTCIPDKVHWHLNPWLRTVDGNNNPDARNFQYGAAVGFDYKVCDTVKMIADYQYARGENEGEEQDHLVELGFDWSLAEDRMLGLSGTIGVDGNDSGDDFTVGVSYIVKLGAPRMDR